MFRQSREAAPPFDRQVLALLRCGRENGESEWHDELTTMSRIFLTDKSRTKKSTTDVFHLSLSLA
jgi:hypothetical protein